MIYKKLSKIESRLEIVREKVSIRGAYYWTGEKSNRNWRKRNDSRDVKKRLQQSKSFKMVFDNDYNMAATAYTNSSYSHNKNQCPEKWV